MGFRVENDALFTPVETAERIVGFLLEQYPGWRELEWFEPSAGGGSFIDAARGFGIDITGIDIKPQRWDIKEADFLMYDNYDLYSPKLDLSGKIVVGNPPYGKYNNLSINFINQAFKLGAEKVAFLLFGGIGTITNLKKINGTVELIKPVLTTFINNDTEREERIKLSPCLVVFNSSLPVRDWDYFKSGPFLEAVDHGKPIDPDCYYMGFKEIGRVNDTTFKPNFVKRGYYNMILPGNELSKKLYLVIKAYNEDFIEDNIEKIRFISDLFNSIAHKPAPNTLNYWLFNWEWVDVGFL